MQSTGSLSRLYDKWRKRLIRCAAHLEAYIDFAEEENIEADVIIQLTKELFAIKREIKCHLDDQRQGEMLRDGVRTVIVGAPNVGKSSFLNLMCQREVAIVTEIAGTTRDIIESTHNFGGYPVRFVDTAGLRTTTSDQVEQQGILKAKHSIEQADLILLIADASRLKNEELNQTTLDKFTKLYLEELDLDDEILSGKRLQLVVNKTDLLSHREIQDLQRSNNVLAVSCKELQAVKPFLDKFEILLKQL